jgi:sulfite exporter TauE/SafE
VAGVLPPILGELQLSASQFIDKLSEVRDVLGETAGSTDDLDLAQARAEATSSQLADAQERLSAANADLIATQDAINEGMLQGSEASTAQSAALERQTVAEGEVRDATLANSEAQGKLAESEVAAADTGVLQDERLIKAGKLVTYAFLGIGAAVVGISVKMAMSFQSSQAKVQAALGQSVKQSNALANSLLGTAGHTEQSASAMEAALAPVAAQFKSLQGGAYTTADTLEEMKAASTLADAGLGSLSDTTGDLAGILQAFQLRAKDAASTADILYSASQLTGQGIDSLTSGLERTRTKLGALAPSLGDLSGLLVDMTEHGETGRAAMSMLTTTMTALLKPTAAAAKAQTDLKATLDAMPPSLRALADEYQSGALTGNSLTAATDGMSTANAALWKAFISAAGAARTSSLASKELGLTVLNNKGQFVEMASVIGQLQEKLKGMSNAQATAELTALGFGSSSAKLLALVRAGPEVLDKATAAATKHGRAENAANLQMKTLHGQLHMLEAAVDDYGVRLGRVLIPKIETVIHVTASVVEWFNKNRVAAYTLAAVVTGVLGVAVTAFAVNALHKLVENAQAAYQAILKLFGLSGAPKMGAMTDDATQAADVLKTGIAEAGAQLIADAKTAAESLVTGGTTAAADVSTGAATGAEDLAAGGVAASEDVAAGGAAAADDLGAGGAAAAEDTAAGGTAAAEDLAAGGEAAAEDTAAGGTAAAEDLAAGGEAAGEDTAAGGVAAGEDVAAGGVAAGEDTAAGGVAAGEDIAAGGVAAGEDVAAGGVAAGEDTAAGGVAAGEDIAAGGVAAGEDEAAGGVAAGEDVAAGGVAASEDIAAGGVAAGEDLVAGGAGAAEDVAAGGVAAGEDLTAAGAAAGEEMAAGGAAGGGLAVGAGAGLGAGAAAGAAGFGISDVILPVLAAQIASMGTKFIPGAAAGEAAQPGWMKDISSIPFVGGITKVSADIGGGIADALGIGKKVTPTAELNYNDPAVAKYLSSAAGAKAAKGLGLTKADISALAKEADANKTTTAVNSLSSKAAKSSDVLKLAKPVDIAKVTSAALKLAKPADMARITLATDRTTAAVRSVKASVDAGHTINVSGDLHTTITLDGRTLAQALRPYQLSAARATGQNVLNSRSVGRGTGNP